jgi:thiamine biosynthesis lipoprotein
VARASGGAFDPAAGALVRDWGFGATRRHDEPGFAMPAGPLPVGAVPAWQTLDFDRQARTLRQPGGVQLDFSGIAKGHAVDRVVRRLRRLCWRDGLVEIGGELSGWGVRPDGLPWWVELSRPDGCAPTARVALHHVAVATSGDDVRRFRDGQGRWRSHTIDPRRGEPVRNGVASVSVLHPSAMVADAWATALTVLGAVEGLGLADRLGLAVYLVERGPGDGDGGQIERVSAALRRWAA